MNNGDDIHNLLRTLGHDAGLYQDLAQYNASRAAVRRAAMARPAEPAPAPAAPAVAPAPLALAPIPQAPAVAAPTPSPVPAGLPRVLRVGPDTQGGNASLSSILHRLASPGSPGQAAGTGHTASAIPPGPGTHPVQPTRLDRLFGRLASRGASPLGR